MNKPTRIILGIALIICGIGLTGFSALLLLGGVDAMTALSLVGGCLFGIMLVLSGVGVATGERIRDILHTIFLSMP
jgi:TM2 domain-containing membrane protein YozV